MKEQLLELLEILIESEREEIDSADRRWTTFNQGKLEAYETVRECVSEMESVS